MSAEVATLPLTAAISAEGAWYVARCLEVEVASQGPYGGAGSREPPGGLGTLLRRCPDPSCHRAFRSSPRSTCASPHESDPASSVGARLGRSHGAGGIRTPQPTGQPCEAASRRQRPHGHRPASRRAGSRDTRLHLSPGRMVDARTSPCLDASPPAVTSGTTLPGALRGRTWPSRVPSLTPWRTFICRKARTAAS